MVIVCGYTVLAIIYKHVLENENKIIKVDVMFL